MQCGAFRGHGSFFVTARLRFGEYDMWYSCTQTFTLLTLCMWGECALVFLFLSSKWELVHFLNHLLSLSLSLLSASVLSHVRSAHNTLPWYLALQETLLQSIGGVTVYHYCPGAIMTQIEGFAVKDRDGAAGTRRVVDMGPWGESWTEMGIHVLMEPHVCMFMRNHIEHGTRQTRGEFKRGLRKSYSMCWYLPDCLRGGKL